MYTALVVKVSSAQRNNYTWSLVIWLSNNKSRGYPPTTMTKSIYSWLYSTLDCTYWPTATTVSVCHRHRAHTPLWSEPAASWTHRYHHIWPRWETPLHPLSWWALLRSGSQCLSVRSHNAVRARVGLKYLQGEGISNTCGTVYHTSSNTHYHTPSTQLWCYIVTQ